ncbi:protein EXORDIUM-like 1 [Pistacia vera]|uniref:protein EXORDIUM-like 1 n=1 Tax=Pistacia vera TaxID=55513 RepID=UPI0012630501|nr:protein EXORDIUM-like 1 [Pistacia vera]
MASFHSSHGLLLIVVLISSLQFNLKAEPVKELFPYHGGPLLSGNIPINLIWYGQFSLAQRAIVSDFIASLSKPTAEQPSVASWMNLTAKFYQVTTIPDSLVLSLGKEVLDENYSQGKSLTSAQLYELAKKGGEDNLINVLLTSADVTVEGFCQGRCGTHALGTGPMHGNTNSKFNYIWVGNSEIQCPGLCAWPFHESINGPKTPPLKAPNSDIGLDGMVINVASLLAGTVTNPFGNGFFQGPQEAPLEASTACPGVFGKGAYPGFAGTLLVDSKTGASYNANGINGKKYLLPAMMDPETSTCTTLV